MEPTQSPNQKGKSSEPPNLHEDMFNVNLQGCIHRCPTFFFRFMVCVSFFMFLEQIHGITNPMGVTLTQVNVVCAFCLVNRF